MPPRDDRDLAVITRAYLGGKCAIICTVATTSETLGGPIIAPVGSPLNWMRAGVSKSDKRRAQAFLDEEYPAQYRAVFRHELKETNASQEIESGQSNAGDGGSSP